jgi:hypothetical protein
MIKHFISMALALIIGLALFNLFKKAVSAYLGLFDE